MELETLGAIAKMVGYVSVIGGGVWALWRKVLKPMTEIIRSRYQALEAIPQIQASLKLITEQLVPNGGSSLRDSIDRLESNSVVMGQIHGVLLTTNNVALVRMDSDGHVIEVSDPLCWLLGRSREELLGNNWISAINDEDREEVETEWNSAMEADRNFESRFCFDLNDGTKVKVYMKVQPTPSIRGKHQGFMGTISRA